MSALARPDSEIEFEARRMARDGYGWENLVVQLGIPEARAKLIVWSEAMKQKRDQQ